MKKFKIILLSLLSVPAMFILACCVFYKCQGIEKIVVPKHVNLKPELYQVVAERSYGPDSFYKEIYYKERGNK